MRRQRLSQTSEGKGGWKDSEGLCGVILKEGVKWGDEISLLVLGHQQHQGLWGSAGGIPAVALRCVLHSCVSDTQPQLWL